MNTPGRRCLGIAILLILLGLTTVLWTTRTAKAQGGSTISFAALSPAQVGVGAPSTWLEVVLTGSDLYGYEFVVEFDPTMVQAVGREFVSSFLAAEYIPDGWAGVIDNVAGTVRFAATQWYPTVPASGSGVIARIAFQGLPSPTLPEYTRVWIRNARVANSDGEGEDLEDAFIDVLVLVPVNLTVQVVGGCDGYWTPSQCLSTTLVMSGQNLYGYQFQVEFDASRLEASGADFYHTFLNADYVPGGWDASIDNVAGTVRFASTQQHPDLPATGSGAVGWICFKQRDGVTEATVTQVAAADVLGSTIDGVGMVGGGVAEEITLQPIVTAQGYVELQARGDHSRCVASALGTPESYTTAANGWYSLRLCPGSYTISLEMARYLDTWRTLSAPSGTFTLPTVQLRGGDANDNDQVEILDIGIIGGKYTLNVDPLTERADINADGKVNILDIGIAAGNYLRTSPILWP